VHADVGGSHRPARRRPAWRGLDRRAGRCPGHSGGPDGDDPRAALPLRRGRPRHAPASRTSPTSTFFGPSVRSPPTARSTVLASSSSSISRTGGSTPRTSTGGHPPAISPPTSTSRVRSSRCWCGPWSS
jgi:hypothetical protein